MNRLAGAQYIGSAKVMFLEGREERLMKRYLFGKLRGASRNRFEERYLRNEQFENLCALESDLIHRYLRGSLTWLDRRRFARAYLGNPARRENVERERALIELLSAAGVAPKARVRRLGPAALRLGMAFTIIALMLGIYRVDRRANPASPAVSRALIPNILLLPGSTERGSPATVRTPLPRSGEIDFSLVIREAVPQRCRASVQDPDGREVWSGETRDLRQTGAGTAAVVRAPAGVLVGTDYVVMLSCAFGSEPFRPLASYTLRVSRDN